MSNKNTTQDSSSKKEFSFEMTREKYEEMKERGIDEEAIPTVGKHTFRRRTHKLNPKDAKIKLTIFIEGDILQYFRKRAEKCDSKSFEIQINQELRRAMERDLAYEENKIRDVAESLINDPSFINAISEKLKAAWYCSHILDIIGNKIVTDRSDLERNLR